MSYLIRSVCFVAALVVFTSVASADGPVQQRTVDVADELSDAGGDTILVANERLLGLIERWIETPAESLFDHRELGNEDEWATPALPISRMITAKYFVYCPGDELPIEAIYRERLANHGVKVISVALPSKRFSLRRNQEPERSFIAKFQ